jgi:ABC-type cobalamin/Fe3+-siderophores transport system ATPase subunit
LHSAAAVVKGQGLVFVGHSEAGKSTTMEMLKARHMGEILCDDRNVIRRWPTGWRVHGTWSHGTIDNVSGSSAPLKAIIFLIKAPHNEIRPLSNRKEIWRRLLATLVRPLVTAEWWQKELAVLDILVKEAEFFEMHFDKSGKILAEIERIAERKESSKNPADKFKVLT